MLTYYESHLVFTTNESKEGDADGDTAMNNS